MFTRYTTTSMQRAPMARGEQARACKEMTMTTTTATTKAARIVALPFDAAALDAAAALLTGKGAAAKAAAILPIVLAVASAIYANGARQEQFFDAAIKNGRARHPAFIALHTGKAPVCRAFRAALVAHGGALTAKGRAMTQEAHDAALAAFAATFGEAAEGKPRASKAQSDLDASKLARAIETIRGAAASMSAEQADMLRAALASYDATAAAIAAAADKGARKAARKGARKGATAVAA